VERSKKVERAEIQLDLICVQVGRPDFGSVALSNIHSLYCQHLTWQADTSSWNAVHWVWIRVWAQLQHVHHC